MGIDYQFIAYQGPALPDSDVADLLGRAGGATLFFRHARSPLKVITNLHCVTLYEPALDLPAAPPAGKPDDLPLSSVLQAVWKEVSGVVRGAGAAALPLATENDLAPERADDVDVGIGTARLLSRKVGTAFWLCQGDHSCVGGYGRFDGGEATECVDGEEMFMEGEAYLDLPRAKWSAALGLPLAPEAVYLRAFPDEGGPPLRAVSAPTRAVPFDPEQYEPSLD